ncbi:hypothetical protein [Aurantiacibacter luteus]|uniref:Glycerophosphoryl diester phosphodiesterase membrane domain-containing protein n=1 Tax=Aurantiacibacter luteus TaxID=1581420 RepID=A0A0G9MX30_9SPHN|nr:hypothetical protein [Aurantiacibacter luteus]KLE35347.1 hypothetical protein AAW00_02550 [Aurantiacibacter luteus]
MENRVDVGNILSRLFRVVGDANVPTMLYTLVIGGLSGAGAVFGLVDANALDYDFGGGMIVDETTTFASGLFQLAVLVLGVVGTWWLLREQLRSQGRLRGEGGGFWTFLGMSILAVLGMIVGFILLIVPGIILLVRWSAANGFAVSRGLGAVESLKVSWEATRGHSWSIFFAGLVLTLGASIVFGGAALAMIAVNDTLGLIVASLLDAFSNALSFAFSVAVFVLVHDDRGETADVFA